MAGLSLGIGLRQRGVPVVICEAGRFPRHRVCGEFISGVGQEALQRLGMRDHLNGAGARWARTGAFFSKLSGSPVRLFPVPAMSLSRFRLDALLAKRFQELGGDLREGERRHDTGCSEGIVCATGRQVQKSELGWRWFGLKVHATNVALEADLEMHLLPNGYVGLCRLAGNVVNVCGLFRRSLRELDPVASWQSLLFGSPNTLLHKRMGNALVEERSFCSVAGLPLRARWSPDATDCRIGDAFSMIPPITGNGMSMAFESAELASEPLEGYSRSEMSWCAARDKIALACRKAFGERLAWARMLQRMMFAPLIQGTLGIAALRSDWLWRLFFAKTRQ